MDEMTKEIEFLLSQILGNANKLTQLLSSFSREIDSIAKRPLAEMSLSEKVKLARLLISFNNKKTITDQTK